MAVDYASTPVSVANLKAYLALGGGLADYKPGDASSLAAAPARGQITLTWTDATKYAQDTSIDASWEKAVVVRKTGSAPTSPSDGTVVVTSTTKDQYKTSGYVDTGLTDGTTYYYKVYTYNNYQAVSDGVGISAVAGYDDTYKPGSATVAAKKGNGQATITWTDTNTITVGGHSGITWSKAELRYAAGSVPSATGGTLAVTETTKNQYSTNGYTVTGLTNNTTYYFAIYTYNSTGLHDDGASASATPKATQVMTVRIDNNDSNPATRCTYMDDAASMTAKSSDWDDFFGHYPVLLKADGTEVGELNPNDFSKFKDGTAADITSGSAGDVMIAFPRRDVRIWTSGNYTYVSMTDDLGADNYTHYAHMKGSVDKDIFYYGAYVASNVSNVGRSLSGKAPYVNISLTNARTNTKSRSGWYLQGFYQRLYVQVMFILKYCSTDGQTALGYGYANGNSAAINTGGTNAKGMDYGETGGKQQMKIFGLEDFWGNVLQWMDGAYYDSSRNILTSHDPANYNDAGSGYSNSGSTLSSNTGGYPKTVIGTSEGGFCGKDTSGSNSTYWPDNFGADAGCCLRVGGYWNDGLRAGPFYVHYRTASNTSPNLGFRVVFI